ncbi:MAG: type II secretion system F family protein [Actinomycetota bacterium]
MIALIALSAGISAWGLARLLDSSDPVVAQKVAAMASSGGRRTRPATGIQRALALFGRGVPVSAEFREALVQSGSAVSAEVLAGCGVLLAGAAVLLSLGTGRLAVLVAPGVAYCAWRLPVIYLKRRSQARRQQIAEALPDAVDLLAVCTQAGLNVALSLKRVSEATGGLLGEELRRVVRETELGVPRRTALEAFSARASTPEAENLVASLAGAESFGSEVSAGLSVLSADMRQRRRRAVEEQARKAPVKILFPLVFVILPAFMLLTVVPLLLGTLDTLSVF